MLTWRMHGAACAGQANYGYGNHACASLCRMRRKLGLPGLTVGWGAVANVGYVVENEQILVSAPAYLGAPAFVVHAVGFAAGLVRRATDGPSASTVDQ